MNKPTIQALKQQGLTRLVLGQTGKFATAVALLDAWVVLRDGLVVGPFHGLTAGLAEEHRGPDDVAELVVHSPWKQEEFDGKA